VRATPVSARDSAAVLNDAHESTQFVRLPCGNGLILRSSSLPLVPGSTNTTHQQGGLLATQQKGHTSYSAHHRSRRCEIAV